MCVNPPSKEHWRNERTERDVICQMVLIGCRHRTDSMQPAREKHFSRKRNNTCLTPFSSSGGPSGPTERAQIKSCLMEIDIAADGSGHILRTNTLLLCRGMRKRLSFVVIRLARPKILDGPKRHFFLRNGTNGHEQPRSIPSGSTTSNRVKTCPHQFMFMLLY